jgi:raffinose/stachyose/melibiose transport system permease protein
MNKIIKNLIFIICLIFILCVFLSPLFIVVFDSLKEAAISKTAADITDSFLTARLNNYYNVLIETDFLRAFMYSLFITIFSTGFITLFSSMTAWMLIRLKNRLNKFIYFCFIVSVFIPFPVLMWSMPTTARLLYLDNPFGIILLYLGFGSGIGIFIFGSFIKKIPLELEEAALIDGCSLIQVFSNIVLPIIRPAIAAVALINTIWVYNDYLMPFLIIGRSGYKTIPMIIMNLDFSLGIGVLSSILLLSIIPMILFFIINRRNIIKSYSIGILK